MTDRTSHPMHRSPTRSMAVRSMWTCSQSTTVTNYGRHASCGVNNSCVWCCQQDYIDPDCEGWCNTAAGETPCPSWHAEYFNECTYTETITTTYDCSYTTTQLCN